MRNSFQWINMENFNQEAEQSVLGQMLYDNKNIDLASTRLKKEHFYFEKHRIIYETILNLRKDGVGADIISVSENIRKQGKEELVSSSYIAQIMSQFSFGNAGNFLHFTGIIINWFKRRELNNILLSQVEELKKGADVNKALGDVSTRISKLAEESLNEKTDLADIIVKFGKLQEEMTLKTAQGKATIGYPIGYNALNKMIDGYREKHLWVISAYTSTGKSSLMINLIGKLLAQNCRVCVFSLEMSQEDLFAKLLAVETEIPTIRLLKELTDNEVYETQAKAKNKFAGKKLSIYSELSDIEDIILAMQSEMAKEKVDVFFIDYIQNITAQIPPKDEYHLLTFSVKRLQAINRKLNSSLVLLSQISNEANKSAGLIGVDGKGSGSIKAAADLFMYLKRDGTEEQILEWYRTGEDIPIKVVVSKNRHGRIGSFTLNLKQKNGIMYEPL